MLEWGDDERLGFKDIHLKVGGFSVWGSVLLEQGEINLGGKTPTQRRTLTTAVPTVTSGAHTCILFNVFKILGYI